MARLLPALAATLAIGVTSAVLSAPAGAEPNIQPVGSVSIPEGPATAWIVADMDTGQVLAGREMYQPHPPASTIKTLLALTALDELNLDSTVVASPADTRVECSCAGIKPGHTYTARQLLDATLLVSGNDAANTLADMLGGYDVAVDKMNAKAAAIGASNTHATSPSGLDGPGGAGWTTPHDLANTTAENMAAMAAQQEAENALTMALHYLRSSASNVPGATRKAVQALGALNRLHLSPAAGAGARAFASLEG